LPSLCCFWCPASDFRDRVPGELCPTCGRAYDSPLRHAPKRVGRFSIQEPISRGFYSAVYRARQESLGRTVVLKVVPVVVYEFFKKDWTRECEEHATIAEGTPFVANITEQFDDAVGIENSSIQCHVAVLENIVGPTLEQVLASPDKHHLTARIAAQIAADLFEILYLFIQRGRFHNDLHSGNIIVQQLGVQMLRSGSIEPSVRAVAIDLGSVLDADRSGDHSGRVLGDQHQIARHLSLLAAAVRGRRSSDIDYRIAGTLQGLAEHLTPAANAQRIMTVDDALQTIRGAMSAVDEPWRQPLSLQRFGDAYNAQAIESWHVPELWFDPDNKWLIKTTARGPQVITGMRGCGKTMLLRALHFHARAAQASRNAGSNQALEELEKDVFLGVYASCQKLLDPQQHQAIGDRSGPKWPFERLYVAYLRDAIQVLKHLRSIDSKAVLGTIDALLRDALKPLEMKSQVDLPPGERAFEQLLLELQFELAEGKPRCRLRMAPAEAFGHLADLVRGAAPVLTGKYVLFLLDDVSTRYLHHDTVREVISQLLFQHPSCAFRITTEAQALQRVLLSPGGSETANPSRDYEEFDLGNEVYRLLKEGSTRESIEFVSEILRRRGRQFRDELYQREPIELLGDVSLEQIASEIVASSASSPARKRVYRGLRALQAVCVGDLGDVVKLYEKILRRANVGEQTVPAEDQCDCFLEHSASLMHFLNRRDEHKKSLALAFAQAAGELLQLSARNGGTGQRRLRQYTKLYVRVDAGPDFDDVATELLALLDAGVFVYDGGVPRTKIRDDDPVLQFKLSYRKILGLASFMGLADRDRFELSGENLRRWLQKADNAKDILVDSEAKTGSRPIEALEGNEPEAADAKVHSTEPAVHRSAQNGRKAAPQPASERFPAQLQLVVPFENLPTPQPTYAPTIGTSATPFTLDALGNRDVDVIIVALGFEDRTRVSAERLLGAVRPRRVLLVRYGGAQGEAIERLVSRMSIPFQVITSTDAITSSLQDAQGEVVVDCSGLSKPFLFVATRDALRGQKRVAIVHTLAEQYYPRNDDLQAHGITTTSQYSEIFSRLEDVLMGEAPPYRLVQVHDEPAEPERWRALLASASAKNDRLLHLLDARTYDAARIFVPPPTSARQRVARAAAELAASAADSNVGLIEVDTNDIVRALQVTEEIYKELYFSSGANVEIGLTGSKMHAVAFAALAAAARISSAWYVSPQTFDEQRFTLGTRETRCFDVMLKE
jgi:hypothetical protein